MTAALLTARDLTVEFPVRGGRVLRAVRGVDLTLARGETLGIVGESGSGKSTLARALARIVDARGEVDFDGTPLLAVKGRELRRLRRQVQMVFQDPFSSLNPRRRVGRSVALPLREHGLARGAAAEARVAELFGAVGLDPSLAERYPHQFSGGQLQRIGIARAMACEPDLLICDEPVSALDVSIQAQVVNLLADLQRRSGVSLLFIAHDLAVVRHISHRVAVMYLGEVVETGTIDDVYTRPAHPYTVALLSSAPVADPVLERRREKIVLRGEIPSAVDPPSGCSFHTRCWLYRALGEPERCRTQAPARRRLAGEHVAACHYADDVASHLVTVGALPAPASEGTA